MVGRRTYGYIIFLLWDLYLSADVCGKCPEEAGSSCRPGLPFGRMEGKLYLKRRRKNFLGTVLREMNTVLFFIFLFLRIGKYR